VPWAAPEPPVHDDVEIGNMTLGAAACCHTKDGLDGVQFAQVSSYLIR
jgi:hypothetical protein